MTQPQNSMESLVRSIVQQAISEAVSELLLILQTEPIIRPRLLSVGQAAQYLGRTKSSIENMVHLKRLPCVRLDKRLYFDVQDLDRWIEAGKEAR